ncbi:MAG: hypothetical protein JOZ18_03275 [Chloroflexi bacterium]|nr:hypothetical protein [Chloroflexota bacterium]
MSLSEDIPLSENITQTTEELGQITQTTEALEQLPRIYDQRSATNGQRQTSLQERNTDDLPSLNIETPIARGAWRLAVHLREENMRLRSELEEQRSELRQIIDEYNGMQAEFDKEVAIVHNGYRQEIEHYQTHLVQMMEERNRIHGAYLQLEQRYQELDSTFQHAVEEEARKMVIEASQTIELSTGKIPALLQEAVKALEAQTWQADSKHLIEALYLKNEVKQMAQHLAEERRQLEEQRQQLFAMQHTAHQQIELHQKAAQARLRARWKVVSLCTSIGLLGLLVTLQFVFLYFLHVKMAPSVSIAVIAPIVLCVVLSFVFEQPFTMIRHMYKSAPHKRKV